MRDAAPIRLALLGAAVACSSVATGQETPPVSQQWVDRQYQTDSGTGQPVNAADEAMDVVFYHYDPPGQPNDARRWAYATGYVTEANGSTRFLTMKYNADWPEFSADPLIPVPRREWPTTLPPANQVNKAVAMTVDYGGNIYVVGESTDQDAGQTGVDYLVLKYDRNLVLDTTNWPAGGYRYDGPVHGNDRPTDIIVSSDQTDVVFVTGTSWNGANNDIVTIALDAGSGAPCGAWPAGAGQAEAVGVRRYNGGGEDLAVELAGPNIACEQSACGPTCELQVCVLGTSWDPATLTFDMLTFKYGNIIDPFQQGVMLWEQRWMGGGDQSEYATGLAWNGTGGGRVIALGYGPPLSTASMMGGTGPLSGGPPEPNHNYHLVVYDYINGALKFWDTVDLTGYPDYSSDVQAAPLGVYDFLFWATGRVTSGSVFDVGTVQWTWTRAQIGIPESLTRNWVALYDVLAGRDDRGVNMAFEAGVTNSGYLTGSTTGGSVTNNDTLTVKYPQTPAPPGRAPAWTILHAGLSGGEDAGRAIAVGDQSPLAAKSSVYIAGRSFKTSQNLDFIVVRYKQD